MFYVFLSCLFVFLGMFIGEKRNFKKVSINMVFGLFLLNSLLNMLPFSFSILSKNYHDTTLIFVVLGIILGFCLMKLLSIKYDETDNVCIAGFSLFNSYLLFLKFSFSLFIINVLYYILIGIYVRKSSSWIYVFVGMIFGLLLGIFNIWFFGYAFTIVFGFLLYFIISVYSIVFKSNGKYSYYSLILGMFVALLGCLL